jgi:hypothetical protein
LCLHGRGDAALAAAVFVKRGVDEHLRRPLRLGLYFDGEGLDLQPQAAPQDLLGALWLQFALSVALRTEYRTCKTCGAWFETDPALPRGRAFCSNRCRSKDYRGKQERSRRLYAGGKSFDEIAGELGSDPQTVKRWITGRNE